VVRDMPAATHRIPRIRLPRVLLPALALLGAGCSSFGFAGVSAEQVGCRSRDIVISDVDRSGNTSWTATCRGKSYVCGADVEGELTCREKDSAASAPPAPPAAPATPPAVPAEPAPAPAPQGCQYDTQCKGDRLCVEGQCVDPPAPDAGVPAESQGAARSNHSASSST
jgi:hypothetical protein